MLYIFFLFSGSHQALHLQISDLRCNFSRVVYMDELLVLERKRVKEISPSWGSKLSKLAAHFQGQR